MWRLLALVFIVSGHEAPHCGVTPEFEQMTAINIQENQAHGRHLALSRGTTLAPIRFYFHFSFDAIVPLAQQVFLKSTIIPAAETYLKNIIKVYPLQQIVLGSTATNCLGFTVPDAHKTTGVIGDILIYVTGYNKEDGTTGNAGACMAQTPPENNIVAGRWSPNFFYYSSMNTQSIIIDAIHSITHVLGFLPSVFSLFHKPNLVPYLSTEITEVITIRGKSATILKLPTVVEKARASFGCNTLKGVELEDQGGNMIAGAHWEKLIMNKDFMIIDFTSDSVMSDISFSVLQDSGWYTIDFSKTDKITWGSNAGCSFFDTQCLVNGSATSKYFCSSKDTAEGCSYDRLNMSSCTLYKYSSVIPSPFNRFSDNTIGGDYYMDYCPIWTPYLNGSCRGNGVNATRSYSYLGNQVCPDCRCFKSNLLSLNYNQVLSQYAGCYKIRCDKPATKYYISIDNTEKECPQGSSISFDKYSGSLECGPYSEVCMDVPCLNMCSQKGSCLNSLCVCNDGYGGNDCKFLCHTTCKKCSGSASNQCTACKVGEILGSDGTCKCQSGYARNTNSLACESCVGLCSECVGGLTSTCTSCVMNAMLGNSSTVNGQVRGSCLCSSGFIVNGRRCEKQCNSLCGTCDLVNGCSGCKSSASLVSGDKFSCACNSGFKNVNNSCSAVCTGLCNTCAVNNGAQCLTCKANATLLGTTCGCNSGFSFSGNLCVAICTGLCSTCNSLSGSQCLSCKTNSILSGTTCTCSTGFRNVNNACVCSGLCATCSPLNGSQCLTCMANAILSGTTCVCKTGYKNVNSVCVVGVRRLISEQELEIYLEATQDYGMIPAYTSMILENEISYDTFLAIESTFIDYIFRETSLNIPVRKLAYSGLYSLLSQKNALSSSDTIRIVGYYNQILNRASDTISQEEVQDILDKILPLLEDTLKDQDSLVSVSESILEILTSTDGKEVNIVRSNSTDRNYLSVRNTAAELSDHIFSLKDIDIHINLRGDQNRLIELSLIQYRTQLDDSIIQVSLNDVGRVSNPHIAHESDKSQVEDSTYELTIHYNFNTTSQLYDCLLLSESETEYKSDLCSIDFSSSDSTLKITSSTPGLLKLQPKLTQSSTLIIRLDENSSIISPVLYLLFSLIVIYAIILRTLYSYPKSSSVSSSLEDISILSHHPNFLQNFKMNHIYFRIFCSDSLLNSIRSLNTLLIAYILDILILGLLLSSHEVQEDNIDMNYIIEYLGTTNFLYCIAALLCSRLCTFMLCAISSFKHKSQTITNIILSASILTASITAVIYMTINNCYIDNLDWTIGGLYLIVIDHSIWQNINALAITTYKSN